jgi:hypothetical protein
MNAQIDCIRVHFLYGSKPSFSYRKEEREWFGGKLGGHVGIEYRDGLIIDFVPSDKFHVFSDKLDFHSRFVSHSRASFYALFGSDPDSVKRAIIEIPINAQQRLCLDSLIGEYFHKTPYDYAFFGMRCGAAGYDILSKIGLLKPWSQNKIQRRIFYPRRLRKRLFDLAQEKNWKVELFTGTKRRKWERDKFRHRLN